MKSHNIERKRKCEYQGCSFLGLDNRAMKIHIDSVHLRIMSLQCDKCDFKTNYTNVLKK